MEAAGGYYQNIGSDSQKVDFNPDYIPSVSLSRLVLEVDIIIQKAKETGLGDYKFGTIEVIGELKRLPDFKLPPLSDDASINNKALRRRLHDLTLLLPQIVRRILKKSKI